MLDHTYNTFMKKDVTIGWDECSNFKYKTRYQPEFESGTYARPHYSKKPMSKPSGTDQT